MNSENGKKNLLEYKDKVKDIAIVIALSNKFKTKEGQISLIIDKVFDDVLEMDL